jgi:phospholipase/lecithinase/hemolysin
MSTIKCFCGALLAALITSQAALAAPFTQAVIFGDSLSDTGNAYEQLGTLAMDPADYYMGRFSNGPVWVEYLAQHLQLAPPVANTMSSAGRDYAFGGARTEGSGFVSLFINDIDEQVPDFINNDGGPTGDELFVILGGANDFLDGETNTAVPVNNLTGSITDLYNAGGRHFMVVNLPLLGQTPRYVGTANESVFDARSTQFNTQLFASLDNLETSLPGVEFFRVDAAAMIDAAVTNPAAYGFTNVTSQAKNLSGIDPDTYLFWDDVHPTTAGHSLLAENAASVLFDALSTIPGDLDFDGFVGINDLNTVLSNWNTNVSPGNPLFGDPTHDGFVGIEDLNLILANWNETRIAPASLPGDVTHDDFVGIEDLNLILANWNAGTPPDISAMIPEPGTLVTLLVLAAGLSKRPRT